MFHVEHEVHFVVRLALVADERVLGDQHQRADAGDDAGFFQELTGQGGGGGLAEFHVSAGEEVVAVLDVSAQQDL